MTLSQSFSSKITCEHCGQKVHDDNTVYGKYCSSSCLRSMARNCNHSGVETVYHDDGTLTGRCEYCEMEIRAKEVDESWLNDTGEIVVTEWVLI